MKLSTIFSFFAVGHGLATERQDECTNPTTRKDWRSLTDSEKLDYIDAVKCLKETISRLDTTSASLYDDFAYVHRELDSSIHLVAGFLPWHRWFTYLFEKALQDDCGYTGNAVYWAWEEDAEDILAAEVFSTDDLGLGGDGDASSHCVVDGAFANFNVSTPSEHCLQREFDADSFYPDAGTDAVDEILELSSYGSFRPGLESGPHRIIHANMGGEMPNNYSPNGKKNVLLFGASGWTNVEHQLTRVWGVDPIFFLHHANIDRIWWKWQSQNSSRTTDYTGNKEQDNSNGEVSLDDIAPMVSGFADTDITMSEVMWVESGLFCYTYE